MTLSVFSWGILQQQHLHFHIIKKEKLYPADWVRTSNQVDQTAQKSLHVLYFAYLSLFQEALEESDDSDEEDL